MKQLNRLAGFLGFCAWAGTAVASVNVDSAANYGGAWTNGSNGGGGFGAWSISAVPGEGWAGNGIWNSANASLNLGESFGFIAKGAGSSITLDRAFTQPLAAGDTFRLDLGLNFDSGSGGNKGFVLRTADNREIAVVNQAGSETITVNGVPALTNYGVNTMYWTFTQVSPTQVAVYATGRAGAETYAATLLTNVASYVANVHFYASGVTNDEFAESRQVYFDNLTLTQGASDTNLFRYSVENGRAVITNVLASASGEIVVPSTLGSYVVGAVGRSAFQGLTNITRVSFAGGASVTNLGPAAFQDCTSLSVVTLPSGLTALPVGLFYGCTGLVSAILPSGVTNIGAAAFAGCRRLAAQTLPAGLSGAGEAVFLNCRSLPAMVFPAGIRSIPNQFCYDCRSLSSIGWAAGTTNIGTAAFYNCLGLGALSFDMALVGVGTDAFAGCDGLERVDFLAGVSSFGDRVFANCSTLTDVNFIGAAPTVGDEVFLGTEDVVVRYLSTSASWSNTFGGAEAEAWTPEAMPPVVETNAFTFAVEWASGQTILVQACEELDAPVWQDVGSYTLVDGTCEVRDTNWVSRSQRAYRLVAP